MPVSQGFRPLPPTHAVHRATLASGGGRSSADIGVLDVAQQHRVAQQDGGEDAAPLRCALLGDRTGSATGDRAHGARSATAAAGGKPLNPPSSCSADIRRQAPDHGMRRAASSSRAGTPRAAPGVASPPASREQVEQGVSQRSRRRTARLRTARRALAANQAIGVLAGRQRDEPQTCGQAPAAAGPVRRRARRHGCPRHRRRSRGSVHGARRQSSSSCSSVSAVPSGATAPPNPGLCESDHVHVAFDHHQARAALAPPRAPDPARRACGAWRTAPSPAR